MSPRPLSRALVRFGDISLFVDLCTYKRNVTVVTLGLLVYKREYAPCSRHRHNDRVDLLGELIDVSRKLLCHI